MILKNINNYCIPIAADNEKKTIQNNWKTRNFIALLFWVNFINESMSAATYTELVNRYLTTNL
jgi:hypothetical protein